MSVAEELARKLGVGVPEDLTGSRLLGKSAMEKAEAMLEKIRKDRKEARGDTAV